VHAMSTLRTQPSPTIHADSIGGFRCGALVAHSGNGHKRCR
jgi:hypothetical protein